MTNLLTSFLLSAIIVALAYWRGSLTISGSVAAFLVGALTFGLGGWQWGVLLALFFVSASGLSHFKEKEKTAVSEKFDKGHRRDMGQVLANGGLGTLLAVAQGVWPSPIWLPLFVGVMATVTADTWATELGTLSRRPPRLITTGRRVEVGTSGGISALGTAVSAAGGLFIGLFAGLLTTIAWPLALLLGICGGLAGSLCDSFLGATVQQVYYNEHKQKETEKKLDAFGHQNRPLRGWSWMNNDLVNLIASLIGGLVAFSIYQLWS